MNDPQKPDPTVFWCKKCQCNCDFVVKQKSASDSQGTSTWEIKFCKICASEGGEPKELKEELIVSAILIGGIILFVDALILGASYKQGAITNTSFMFVVTCASLFLFSLLWFAPRIGDIFCYLKWKKWAKERGWDS